MSPHDFKNIISIVRRISGQTMIGYYTDGINIGTGINFGCFHLFGSRIGWITDSKADTRFGRIIFTGYDFGKAEIKNFDEVFFGAILVFEQHQVSRTQITMNIT